MTIFLVDEHTRQLTAVAGTDLTHPITINVGRGVVGSVATTGIAVSLGNHENSRFRSHANSRNRDHFEAYSTLAVPMKAHSNGRVFGVIEANNKIGGSMFSAMDQKLTTVAGNFLSLVLWSEELREVAIREKHKTRSLFQSATSLYSAVNLRALLSKLIERMRVFVSADFSLLFAVNRKKQHLEVVSQVCSKNVNLKIPDSYATELMGNESIAIPLNSRALVAKIARKVRSLSLSTSLSLSPSLFLPLFLSFSRHSPLHFSRSPFSSLSLFLFHTPFHSLGNWH